MKILAVFCSLIFLGCSPKEEAKEKSIDIHKALTEWNDSLERNNPEIYQLSIDGELFVVSTTEIELGDSGLKVIEGADVDGSRFYLLPEEKWIATMAEVIQIAQFKHTKSNQTE